MSSLADPGVVAERKTPAAQTDRKRPPGRSRNRGRRTWRQPSLAGQRAGGGISKGTRTAAWNALLPLTAVTPDLARVAGPSFQLVSTGSSAMPRLSLAARCRTRGLGFGHCSRVREGARLQANEGLRDDPRVPQGPGWRQGEPLVHHPGEGRCAPRDAIRIERYYPGSSNRMAM